MVTTIVRGETRVEIPDDVREVLGLQDGAVVTVERQGADVLLRATGDSVDRLFGVFHAYAIHPVLTDDDLDEAIARAIADDFANEDYGRTTSDRR